ncbi:MAG: DUF4363 family protein [Oscillospiraceae bacterium]|jgi:hypothetical protein|nr:DUF4363 family protein [Oscillospiraceae bacterium]
MRKEWVICALFLLMCAGAWLCVRCVSDLTGEVRSLADAALDAAYDEQWSRAQELSAEALTLWRERQRLTRSILRHSVVEAVEAALSNFCGETLSRELGHAVGAHQMAVAALNAVADAEVPSLQSVF